MKKRNQHKVPLWTSGWITAAPRCLKCQVKSPKGGLPTRHHQPRARDSSGTGPGGAVGISPASWQGSSEGPQAAWLMLRLAVGTGGGGARPTAGPPCPALMEKPPLEGGDPEAGRPRAQGPGQREGWSVPTAAVRAGTGPAARPQGRSTRLRGCRPQAHDGVHLLHQK